MAQGVHNMSASEKDALITALMHIVKPEGRNYLMRVCPAAYNSFCGSEIVHVVRSSDGVRVDELL